MNSDQPLASAGASKPAGDSGGEFAPSAEDLAARRHVFEETDEEDLRWVRATLAGDKTAYDKLYTKHRDRVYGVVYRITRNREDALEGVQEVFVKVYRALPRYKAEYRFGAWLYRISMNHAIDIYRRKRVRKEQIYDQEFTFARPDAAVHQRFADPAEEMDRRQVAQTIEDAMSSLSENHRQIFTLFSFDEMSYQEISDLLDIPIGTVMSRLYYARRKLQEALPESWDPGGRKNRQKREVDHE